MQLAVIFFLPANLTLYLILEVVSSHKEMQGFWFDLQALLEQTAPSFGVVRKSHKKSYTSATEETK